MEVESTIKITINGTIIELTRSEAYDLYKLLDKEISKFKPEEVVESTKEETENEKLRRMIEEIQNQKTPLKPNPFEDPITPYPSVPDIWPTDAQPYKLERGFSDWEITFTDSPKKNFGFSVDNTAR